MINLIFTAENRAALEAQRYHHPHPKVQRKMEALYLKSLRPPYLSELRVAPIGLLIADGARKSLSDLWLNMLITKVLALFYENLFLAPSRERCHLQFPSHHGQFDMRFHHNILSFRGFSSQSNELPEFRGKVV